MTPPPDFLGPQTQPTAAAMEFWAARRLARQRIEAKIRPMAPTPVTAEQRDDMLARLIAEVEGRAEAEPPPSPAHDGTFRFNVPIADDAYFESRARQADEDVRQQVWDAGVRAREREMAYRRNERPRDCPR